MMMRTWAEHASTDVGDVENDNPLVTTSLERPKSVHASLIRLRSGERQLAYSETGASTWRCMATNHLTVECLVSVRAQVMIWDEIYGGWLPLDGGGVCGVSLLQQVTCQQTLAPSAAQPSKRSSWSAGHAQSSEPAEVQSGNAPNWEYRIQGKRISDQKILLNCTLLARACYRAALPTFHHWRVTDKKYGLSFGSSYDAAKFHNRLQKALDHLSRQSKSSSGESNLDASDELEDDVFAPIDLPQSADNTSTPDENPPMDPVMPSKESSLNKSTVVTEDLSNQDMVVPFRSDFNRLKQKTTFSLDLDADMPLMHSDLNISMSSNPHVVVKRDAEIVKLIAARPRSKSRGDVGDRMLQWQDKYRRKHSSPSSTRIVKPPLQLHYSPMERYVPGPGLVGGKFKRDSLGNLKSVYANREAILLPLKKPSVSEIITRERCYYCRSWYNVKENEKGVCREAPDPVRNWIKRLSCYHCAEAAVFCCNREDGELPTGKLSRDACSCAPERGRAARWSLLAVLSIFIPCLCCYWPMRALAVCCCGVNSRGRHKPSSPSTQGSGRNSRASRTTSRLSM